MREYWLDPPEYEEEDEEHHIPDDEPPPAALFADVCDEEDCEIPVAEKCPHGNEWGECDHCDHEGDMAFDAARERRMR